MTELRETPLERIQPLQHYVACHRSGPSFRGPTAGMPTWTDGVAGPVQGIMIRRWGMVAYAVFFEHHAGYKATWDGKAWRYVRPPRAPAPSVPLPPVPLPNAEEPSSELRPVEPEKTTRRARCSGCGKMYSRKKLVEGLCKKCRS